MDTFSLVNIFETKGAEYLLVIAFLLLFTVFARYLGLTGRDAHPDRGAAPKLADPGVEGPHFP